MLKVKSIDAETINGWPVSDSGLPVRAVNVLAASGITTIGELRNICRTSLKELKGMGNESVREIDRFLETCSRIRAGKRTFDNLERLFTYFLAPAQYKTLELRYNLRQDNPTGQTLDSIGRNIGTVRERVRQIEAKSIAILSTKLSQACLSGVYDMFEDFITNGHSAVPCETVSALGGSPLINGYSPRNLLHMLCAFNKRIICHNGLFTTVPAEKIICLEKEAIELLATATTPQPQPAMLAALSAIQVHPIPAINRHVINCILNRCHGIYTTLDDRYFTSTACAASLLVEILHRHPAPLPFRAITHQYNQMMKPGSRKGSRCILDLLSDGTLFRKTSNGLYETILRT